MAGPIESKNANSQQISVVQQLSAAQVIEHPEGHLDT